jgi:uncharacterized protein YdhG (YjbR/CyaY superfamily)
MQKLDSVAAYLAALAPAQRKVLTAVRKLIKKAAPDCDEVISYGIPGYKMNGRTGVFFSAWKEHWSLYPVTVGVELALGAAALKKHRKGKGTLQFSYEDKLPTALITKFVKVRHAEAHALKKRKR